MEYISFEEVIKNKYVIPCFQREYSWESEEIEDLLYSIENSDSDCCIGIITIKSENGKVLLVDGQQRLTTLYMIAISTGYIENKNQILLEKELADEFKKIKDKEDGKKDSESNDLIRLFDGNTDIISANLLHGWNIIKSKVDSKKQAIKNKLNNIKLYIVNLDDDIVDLNHYFEVMNSRGVQLSRSDMVKAILMKPLDDDDKRRLNNLWNMLDDMKDIRKKVKLNSKKGYFYSISPNSSIKFSSIKEIVKKSQKKKIEEEDVNNLQEDDNKVLNLDYFLLYVIRLYNDVNGVEIQNKMFDLKDLDDEYRKCFLKSTKDDVIDFLNFLIKTKINYEMYVVLYDKNNSKYKINNTSNEKILDIQTCLRVSFTERKTMHWIYETLKYFNNDTNKEKNYVESMRNFIRDNYIDGYINNDVNEKNNYVTGVETPHIVLNYLDYLLKVDYKKLIEKIPELGKIKINDFTFKSRDSVEHYMPRENEKGYKWVDDFGNLALLAYNTNTHIQNSMPSEKNQYFENHNLSDYSIKLQIMYYMSKDAKWEWPLCEKLRDKCIDILKEDLKKLDNTK